MLILEANSNIKTINQAFLANSLMKTSLGFTIFARNKKNKRNLMFSGYEET